ncbi:MAG: glycosyltransferase [Candidatus Lokiarchaeota archaeon]|nr:glycosyltransferase [Candidatus Lokiarchaeota archaeon]
MLEPVSIVIPIKNRAYYLPNLFKNLSNLDYPQYEIIIVDDCSTDNTKDLLKQYPIRSISLKKSVGSAKARNIGIKEARNEIIALTDSDCFVSRNWLTDLVPHLNINDVVAGKVIFRDDIENKLNPSINNKTIISEDSPVNFLNTSNMLFKKSLWSHTSGFLNYRLEDVEFSWRLLKGGYRLFYVPKGLVIHHGTRNPFQNFKKYLQYGKSYSKLSYIHKMHISNKSEAIFDNRAIWEYFNLVMILIGLYIALFICYLTVLNIIFSFSFLTISVFLFTYLIFRMMKRIDILYRLYKLSFFFTLVVYMLIYTLKSQH